MNPATHAVVLLVEDEHLIRFSTAALLEQAGFQVLEASDAGEAISLLKAQRRVDVLFTDINLPGEMDGVALAHRVRSTLPSVPVILTSGESVPSGDAMPVEGRFVAKPYSTDLVAQMIAAMLASG